MFDQVIFWSFCFEPVRLGLLVFFLDKMSSNVKMICPNELIISEMRIIVYSFRIVL